MHALRYAGIGSRTTPRPVLEQMKTIAARLGARSWRLRSGGASGADAAFLAGAPAGTREIMLPWPGYLPSVPPAAPALEPGESQVAQTLPAYHEMVREAQARHPAWHRCGRGARSLHARNVAIVLGADLRTPVRAVVCWTPDGEASGGTGLGIRIAHAHGIPVWNLKRHTAAEVCEAIEQPGSLHKVRSDQATAYVGFETGYAR